MPGQGQSHGQVLVIHERIGAWARQIRPRLADRPVRVLETRSEADLASALRGPGQGCPIVLIDLGRRPRAGLEHLILARNLTHDGLILVLDPHEHEGLGCLARELGATLLLAGPVTPPTVTDLVVRWLTLAQRRTESLGWLGSAVVPPEPEPWNWLTPLIASALNGTPLPPTPSP